MQRALITGGAGFIGSNLADRLVADGVEVVVYDNLTTGRREFLSELLERPGTRLVEADVLDTERLQRELEGCDTVFHLAANADVRHGLDHPRKDLEQNTIATSSVLEAMRGARVSRIAFSSTGSVYGEPEVFPTPENCPNPIQTSLYGASKMAGESLIQAYCAGYGFTGVIFRFVSIMGERYTHGHVYDFVDALTKDPTRLHVLGDGRQEKSYLYVGDCVRGILTAVAAQEGPGVEIYNLGHPGTLIVDDSVAAISQALGVSPTIEHAGGSRGWIGDSPRISLDTAKIEALGWTPERTIPEALGATVDWLQENRWVFEESGS